MKKFYKLGYSIIALGAAAVAVASFLNKRISIVDEEKEI